MGQQAEPEHQGESMADAPLSPKNKNDDALNGTRKLVRPKLPPELANRGPMRRNGAVLSVSTAPERTDEDNHAEIFYLQKQVQMQTPMVVVLEDGEEITGVIEWFDRDAIRIRGSRRVMIYKDAIRYMYKHGEQD
jgi:sRNA-binding regulator protein Hfq